MQPASATCFCNRESPLVPHSPTIFSEEDGGTGAYRARRARRDGVHIWYTSGWPHSLSRCLECCGVPPPSGVAECKSGRDVAQKRRLSRLSASTNSVPPPSTQPIFRLTICPQVDNKHGGELCERELHGDSISHCAQHRNNGRQRPAQLISAEPLIMLATVTTIR